MGNRSTHLHADETSTMHGSPTSLWNWTPPNYLYFIPGMKQNVFPWKKNPILQVHECRVLHERNTVQKHFTTRRNAIFCNGICSEQDLKKILVFLPLCSLHLVIKNSDPWLAFIILFRWGKQHFFSEGLRRCLFICDMYKCSYYNLNKIWLSCSCFKRRIQRKINVLKCLLERFLLDI